MVKLRRRTSKASARADRARRWHNPRIGQHRNDNTHELMMSNRRKRNRRQNKAARAARRRMRLAS